MGSDHSPLLLFKAVEQAANKFPQILFVIFLTQVALEEIFLNFPSSISSINSNIELKITSDSILMDDDPLIAIRQKKDSSLLIGLKYLKRRYLDGFVSTGNTGALIAGATLSLPLLPGIKRPALLAVLPTQTGKVAIIDVGGNVSCKAYHLAQFAQLGIAYQRCQEGIAHPRIGLLNIGVESKKGTSEIRQAYEQLEQMAEKEHLVFMGNIEGQEVFRGAVDVLVTDGFTGNILLKTSEGVSSFILHELEGILQQIATEKELPILKQLQSKFDYEEYTGAIICGIDGVAVKCHGQSSWKGLLRGIEGAIQLVQNGFINQIKQQLSISEANL